MNPGSEYDITITKAAGEEFVSFKWRRGLTAGNDTPHEDQSADGE